MAEAGLFVGWGPPIRGREAKGLEVLNEAISWWGSQQENGKIESFEVVILAPHGGDLNGFILVRGSQDQIRAVQADEEFEPLHTRASLVVDRLGMVDAALGDGLGQSIEIYQQAINEIG
jgi:hypothetical protein